MSLARENFEAVVVGGGPAGAAAAIWLAQAGADVALLDRARFPRDKACGEFLTPQTRLLLTDLGVWETACAAGLRPLSTTLLCAPDGREMRRTAGDGSPAGYAIRRVTLDAVLIERARQAGVQVREGSIVRELHHNAVGCLWGVSGKSVAGEPFTLRTRLVIGADGAHSFVARRLGLVHPLPRLQRVAVVSHWRDVAGNRDAIEMRASGPIVCGMSFPGGEGGRITSKGVQTFRRSGVQENADRVCPDHQNPAANLTLVVPTSQASRIAGRAGDWIEQTLQMHFPDLAVRLAGAQREPQARTIGCFGHVCRPALADGALLVGDAAAFIDPFTGEGVYFALRGAQLAAEVAARALQADDMSLRNLLPYQHARRELVRRYLLCDIVQAVVRTPALLNRVVHRLNRFPGAADRLLDVLGDLRPATAVLHPALLWRLLAPCF